jgi:integrase
MSFRSAAEAMALPAPADKPFFEYWHEHQQGFGVRVMRATRGGAVRRVWIMREQGTNGRKPILGEVGELTYDDAFDEVRRLRKLRRGEQTGGVAVPTLEAAYAEYLRDKKDRLTEATLYDFGKRVQYWKAKGSYLTDITRKRLDELTDKVWRDRFYDIEQHHGRTQAKRVLALASIVYNHARALNAQLDNPIKRLTAILGIYERSPARTDIITEEQLPAWWAEVRSLGGPQRDFLLWVLFTGFRHSLAGSLEWSRLDTENRVYKILRTDRGNKARRDIEFPLPDWLVENVVLPRLAVRSKGERWVIPSPKRPGGPMKSVRGACDRIEERLGVSASPHDIRATFATRANAVVGLAMAGALLTHTVGRSSMAGVPQELQVTAGYVVHTGSAMREAINRVAASLLRLCGQSKPAVPAPKWPAGARAKAAKHRRV